MAFTRRGHGRLEGGPPCHTCGGAGVWIDVNETTGDRRPVVCYDCPAFYELKGGPCLDYRNRRGGR